MTTLTWSTVVDQTTDAAFRVWGSELAAKLLAVGLTQTADTGQINWVTVNRAALNTAAGYEIWRFADSSIYFKIEYGSASSSIAIPQMWLTVGTGSNGSGTITGQTSSRVTFAGATIASTVTAYTSRMCRVADALCLCWKETGGGVTIHLGGFVIGKTVDGAGVASSTGFGVIRWTVAAGSLSIQCVRTASVASTGTDSNSGITVPNLLTNSVVAGGNFQAFQIPGAWPEVLPFNWAATVIQAEVPRGTTFVVAMVGSTTHTYIGLGQISNQTYGAPGLTPSTYGLAMIFE